MKINLLIIALLLTSISVKGQTKTDGIAVPNATKGYLYSKHFATEIDSLRIAVKTHEAAEKVMSDMLYKMAVKNDSLTTAYNKLLIEYKQFAIYVKNTLSKIK
jgi:hypothetical protein